MTRSRRPKKGQPSGASSSSRPAVVDAPAEPEVEEDEPKLEDVEPDPEALAEEVDAGLTGGVDSDALVPAAPVLPPSEVASDRGLVRRDPLQVYMAEVVKHPLLTREEEHELAVKYREHGDLDAAYRLVASNLRLVVKLAHEYHRNPLSLLDLIQEGNIGLMQAVKKYDPHRGVKLSSYAAWWIRAYLLRYIMDNWKMVKIGTTEAQRKLFFRLRQEQERLAAQGFESSPKLLADRLNVSEQDVIEMDRRLGQDELSLDAPLSEEGSATRADRLLPSNAAPVDDRLANEELKAIFKAKLGEFAKTLKDKERYIFENRLIAEEPLTLQDIGDHYGVSRERARQIEASLISRIREHLRSEIPDFDLVAVENAEKES